MRGPGIRFAAALITLGLLATTAMGSTASAQIIGCRTDPQVFLSNGMRVELSDAVNADAVDVDEVVYTLHLPVGVTPTRVVYTGRGLFGKETLLVFSDNPDGQYDGSSVVYSAVDADVTHVESVFGQSAGGGIITATDSGSTNQTLQTTVLD